MVENYLFPGFIRVSYAFSVVPHVVFEFRLITEYVCVDNGL